MTSIIDKAKASMGKNLARIGYVPRHSLVTVHTKQPVNYNEESPPTNNQVRNYQNYKPRRDVVSPSNMTPSLSLSNDTLKETKPMKKPDHGIKNGYKQLTPGKQTAVKALIGTLVVVGVTAAVMVPVYFFVIRPASSETTSAPINQTSTTISLCPTSTCIGQETPYRSSMVTVLYPFDNNLSDQTGYATGTIYGTATASFSTGFLTSAVSLPTNSLQYIQIPNLNFAQQSFTIQTWFYPFGMSSSSEYCIFSQCDIYNVCLSISIRNTRIVSTLDSMNATSALLTSTTSLSNSTWYHLTVVYDINAQQQKIYINGRADGLSSNNFAAYRGIVTSLTTAYIAKGSSYAYGTTYYQGRLDHFTISLGSTRTACQILNDATLIVYFPFDTIGTYNDYGVNLCISSTYGTTLISDGHINQAISFNSSYSYFQSQCFPKLRGGIDQAFSMSLWIKPYSIGFGGSIVHSSSLMNGSGVCFDMLALTTNGTIVLQWMTSLTNVVNIQGSVIPTNTWTHIAYIFSYTYGARLYINGQLNVASLTTNFQVYDLTPSTPSFITLGHNTPLGPIGVSCLNGSTPFVPGPFSGAIDDFRLYYRDISINELCVLANQ